jgi:hypothetical protein
MGELVNLNRVRKQRERAEAEAAAGVKRAKFGRSKTDRTAEEARAHRNKTMLEQHRIEREDES